MNFRFLLHQFWQSLLRGIIFIWVAGAFTIREDTYFQIRNPEIGAFEEQWMSMLAHVGPLSGAVTKLLIWTVARPIRIIWSPETVGKFLPVDSFQSLVDCLYYRTDESVKFGERLDWPAFWPKGTYVDIACSKFGCFSIGTSSFSYE